jgi:hypothetical protein
VSTARLGRIPTACRRRVCPAHDHARRTLSEGGSTHENVPIRADRAERA